LDWDRDPATNQVIPQIFDQGGELRAESFSLITGRFDLLAGSAQVPRHYHSVALLMPDGRVWTAGSSKDRTPAESCGETRIEIYAPWYCNPGISRPRITNAPTQVVSAERFRITCTQASSIARAALIRAASVTHAFSSDQRYVGLIVTAVGGDQLDVTAPPSLNIAPPGYYLLFIVNSDNVPSEGKFIQLTGA
jgi:hypothetical protein